MESAAPGYSEPLRTLNGELLRLSPLRGLTVVKQAPFLTGSSKALRYTPSTDASKNQYSGLLQTERAVSSLTYLPSSASGIEGNLG